MKTTKKSTGKEHKMTIEEKNAFKIHGQKLTFLSQQLKKFIAIRRQRMLTPSEQVEHDRLLVEINEERQIACELITNLTVKN